MSDMKEMAAIAMANARFMRGGGPPVNNILQILPDHAKAAVLEDAEAALDAVGAGEMLDVLRRIERAEATDKITLTPDLRTAVIMARSKAEPCPY